MLLRRTVCALVAGVAVAATAPAAAMAGPAPAAPEATGYVKVAEDHLGSVYEHRPEHRMVTLSTGAVRDLADIASWPRADQKAYLDAATVVPAPMPRVDGKLSAAGPGTSADPPVTVDGGPAKSGLLAKAGFAAPPAGAPGGGTDANYYSMGTPNIAVGKIWARSASSPPNVFHVCSGSLVGTASVFNRGTILTAAHCLPAPLAELYFVPGANTDGSTGNDDPYGIYPAYTYRLPDCWNDDVSWACDFAYIAMPRWRFASDPNYWFGFEDLFGAMGQSFNRAPGATVHNYGYPTMPQPWYPTAGNQQWMCVTPTRQVTIGGRTFLEDDCNYGPGASGGPWLADYNLTSRYGNAIGVNSFIRCNPGGPPDCPWNHVYSSRLDTTAQNLWSAVQSISTPVAFVIQD